MRDIFKIFLPPTKNLYLISKFVDFIAYFILKYKKEVSMNDYVKHLKRKVMFSRITGIFACLVAIAGLVLKLLGVVADWWCIIMIAYAIATIFLLNANIQDIRVGNPWQRINTICSLIMFLFVIFLLVYGFTSGQFETQF